MSAQQGSLHDDGRIPHRWSAWLKSSGWSASTAQRQVTIHDRSEGERGGGPAWLFAHEVFARADIESRGSLDLLLVAFFQSRDHPESGELLVVSPEDLRARAHSAGTPGGLTIGEIALSRPAAGLRVSIALIRVDRSTRAREVAASVAALGRLIDYEHDGLGSDAVAHTILRRLEVLTSGPGVEVSVAGFVGWAGEPTGAQAMHLLTYTTLGLEDEVEYRQGRLMITSGAEGPSRSIGAPDSIDHPAAPTSGTRPSPRRARHRRPWQEGDYVLVRVGQASTPRVGAAESLERRRAEYTRAAEALGVTSPKEVESSYSSRAAAARQEARARHLLELSVAGNHDAATRLLASALTQPGASGPLVDSVTSGIGTVTDFWAVLPVVEGAITDPDAEAGARATAVTIRDRLGDRLDHLLLLDPDDAESPDVIPIVTPIVLEVSDLLVPIVDSRQDGGRFLYELIPAMRERITESTGLAIPGVRARGNPGLPPGGFVIQIDEIPRIEASMRPDGHYTARADAGEAYPAEGEVTEIHPVTSALGRWLIKHHPEDEIPDLEPAATFTPAEYLSHRIERVIRADLGKFLGMQEFQALLERWRDDDPVPVVRLLGNRALGQSMAEERLKVLLKDLVAERVPITDWRAVLASVVTAGGIETDLRVLHRAIRLQLREALPGWRSGPMLEVPGPIQTALSGQEIVDRKSADAAHTEQARLQFLNWLHGIIGQYGSVISLIAHDAEIRETVALLARTERAVVATFSAEEVTTA